MLSATFVGEIRQGSLRTSRPLSDFEGKCVLVTFIVPDAPRPLGEDASLAGGEAPPEPVRLGRRAKPLTLLDPDAELLANFGG